MGAFQGHGKPAWKKHALASIIRLLENRLIADRKQTDMEKGS
jgi:hypothetical protein